MEDCRFLSSAEKKKLRGFAQAMSPHVYVGKHGLTENVLKEVNTALTKNGLIKVRFEAERSSIDVFISEIAESLHCEYVGGVGKVGVFFREMTEEDGDS